MTHIVIPTSHHAPRFSVLQWVHNMLSLARQRRALAGLDDRGLEDIGITRAEAHTEAARPPWDAPDNWHKHLY